MDEFTKDKERSRFSNLLIGIFIVAFILLAAVWYTKGKVPTEVVTSTNPTQSGVEGWQTYRNDKYGFEFKYPENVLVTDWGAVGTFRDAGFVRDDTIILKVADSCSHFWDIGPCELTRYEFDISFPIGREVVTPDGKWLEYLCNGQNIEPSGEILSEPVTFQNYQAVHVVQTWNTGIAHVSHFYCINATNSPMIIYYDDKIKTDAEKMLATFKFFPSNLVGKFCGGIAGIQCEKGYVCKYDGTYPDAGGHCVVPFLVGTLEVKVTIGPNCPVEQIDNPCPTSPEAYAEREFLIISNNNITITRFHADENGNYRIVLPPGKYTIESAKTGIGFVSKDLPSSVVIEAGKTVTLDISVDTGIR